MLEIQTPETRLKQIVGKTDKIFCRTISDLIASIRGQGAIVPTFELPSKASTLFLAGIDNRLVDIFSEDNENGTVEITVFSNEVRIFNPHTLRSLFIFSVKPYLKMDGLSYTSPVQRTADAFLQALAADEFQDPNYRKYERKEEQFAAYKNAYNILGSVAASKSRQ